MRWMIVLATLWLALGMALSAQATPAPDDGVLRSPIPVAGDSVVALLASPKFQFDRTLYLVTDAAIWRSVDGGGSWLEAANLPDAGRREFTAATIVDGGANHHQLLVTTAGGALWRIDPAQLDWRLPRGAVATPPGALAITITYDDDFYVETFGYTPDAPNIRHYALIMPVHETAPRLRDAKNAFYWLQFPATADGAPSLRPEAAANTWVLPYLHPAPGGQLTTTLAAGDYLVWAAFIAAPLSREAAGVGDDAILWAGVTGGGASTRTPVTATVKPNETTALDFLLTDANGWACPWLYVHDGTDYVRVTELLRNQEGADNARQEVTNLGRVPVVDGAVRLRLAEEKAEIAYFDALTVLVDGVAISLPTPALQRVDGRFLRLRPEAMLDFDLVLPAAYAGLSHVQVTVIATGYYQRADATPDARPLGE